MSNFRPTENEEPTLISKLLAGGYEKDWYDKLAELSGKEEKEKVQKKQASAVSTMTQRWAMYFYSFPMEGISIYSPFTDSLKRS